MSDRFRDSGGYKGRSQYGQGFAAEARPSGTKIPVITETVWQNVFADLGRDWSGFVKEECGHVNLQDGSLGPLNVKAREQNFSPYFAFGYLVMRAGLRKKDEEFAMVPPRTVARFEFQLELRKKRAVDHWWAPRSSADDIERDLMVGYERLLASEQTPFFLALNDVWVPGGALVDFVSGAAQMYALARIKDADDGGVWQQIQEAGQGSTKLTSTDRWAAYNDSPDPGPSAFAHAFALALERTEPKNP